MFSRTTMASSMRMPIASDRPSSDIVFSVKPKTHTATNEASTDTGSARPVMTVERHELRNTNTTSTVSSGAFDQGVLHVGHRVGDARPGVARDHELDARRQRLLDVVDLGPDAGADVGGAGAVGLDDVDADRVAAVEHRGRPRLLGRVFGHRDVAQADQPSAALRHDQPGEVGRAVEAAAQADRALGHRLVDAADRRRQVLRLQRLHHLADADAGGLQRLRIELDGQLALDAADDADLGDAA